MKTPIKCLCHEEEVSEKTGKEMAIAFGVLVALSILAFVM